MSFLIIGGKPHAMGTKTEFNYARIDKWYKENPERVKKEYESGPLLKDLLIKLLQVWDIKCTCVSFLKELHQSLAKKFVEALDKNVNNIDISFSDDDDFPHNYTTEVIKLKNARFEGYDHESLKGYCPFEPLIRLEQLLDFPIYKFENNEYHVGLPTSLNFPEPPKMPEGLRSQDLIEDIKALRPTVENWEKYYDSLCEEIKKITDSIHN